MQLANKDQIVIADAKTAKPYLVDDYSTAKLWLTEQGRWAVTGPRTSGYKIFEASEKREAILAFADEIPRE